MKRPVAISFVCAAIALMLSVSFTPHHHHEGVVCAAAHALCGEEECGGCHGDGGRDAGNSGVCIAETLFTPRYERSGGHADCGSPSCGGEWHIHLFAIPCFDAEIFPDLPCTDTDTGEPAILYRSIHAHSAVGLRAPPVPLC